MKELFDIAKLMDDLIALIPQNTPYCYDKNGICPFWTTIPDAPEQLNGYCHYLQAGDNDEEPNNTLLLWDQCKECGISDNPFKDGDNG